MPSFQWVVVCLLILFAHSFACAALNPFFCEQKLLSKNTKRPALQDSALFKTQTSSPDETPAVERDPLKAAAKALLKKGRDSRSVSDQLLHNMKAALSLATTQAEKVELLKHYWRITENDSSPLGGNSLTKFGLALIEAGEVDDGRRFISYGIDSLNSLTGADFELAESAKEIFASERTEAISILVGKISDRVKTYERQLQILKKKDLSQLSLQKLKQRDWSFSTFQNIGFLGPKISQAAHDFEVRGENSQAEHLRKLAYRVYRFILEAGLYERSLNAHLTAKRFNMSWDSKAESIDDLFWRLRRLPNFNPSFDGLRNWQPLLLRTLHFQLSKDSQFFRLGLKYLEHLGPNLHTLEVYKAFSEHFPQSASVQEVRSFIQQWDHVTKETAQRLPNYHMVEEPDLHIHSQKMPYLISEYPELADRSRWASWEDSHLMHENRREQAFLLLRRPEAELNREGLSLLSGQLERLNNIPPFQFNPYNHFFPCNGPCGFMTKATSGAIAVLPFLNTSLFKVETLNHLIPVAPPREREWLLDEVFKEAKSFTLPSSGNFQNRMAQDQLQISMTGLFEASRLLYANGRWEEGDLLRRQLTNYLEQLEEPKIGPSILDDFPKTLPHWISHVKVYLLAASAVSLAQKGENEKAISLASELMTQSTKLVDHSPDEIQLFTLLASASLLSIHPSTTNYSKLLFEMSIPIIKQNDNNYDWHNLQMFLESLANSQLSADEKDRLTGASIDAVLSGDNSTDKLRNFDAGTLQFLLTQIKGDRSLFRLPGARKQLRTLLTRLFEQKLGEKYDFLSRWDWMIELIQELEP